MNAEAALQPAQPVDFALACVLSLVGHHKQLRTALREVAHHRGEVEVAAAAAGDAAALQQQLDVALDHGLRSISALHLAAAAHHQHLQPDVERRSSHHALECLSGFVGIHGQLRDAVRKNAMQDRSPRTGIWPSVWANLSFQLDEMHTQANASIDSIATSARQEAAQAASKAQVFGIGEQDFEVLVTLQATAHRFFHVRADDLEAAREAALAAAQEEQGAHFVLNEGNFVTRDDVHVSLVNDDSGNELWNDGPEYENEASGMAPG
jgi:hypothetical protein